MLSGIVPAFSATRNPIPFGDAMAEVARHVVVCHALFLQERSGLALTLGENGDQHISLAPVTSSRPEDCTWITARWITRWKPAVGSGSRPSSVTRVIGSLSIYLSLYS